MQTKGIIRNSQTDIMSVYSPSVDNTLQCYYDSYSKTYCVSEEMSAWIKQQALYNQQWRFTSNIESKKITHAATAPDHIIAYYCTATDDYCIPGITTTWSSKQSIFDLQYRFTNTLDSVGVINSTDPTTEVCCFSSNDNGVIVYCIPRKITTWVNKEQLESQGWRIKSDTSTVLFINSVNPTTTVNAYYDSESEQYCIPGSITTWSNLTTLFIANWRPSANVSTVSVFKPSVSEEPLTGYVYTNPADSSTTYCIPGHITIWVEKQAVNNAGWKFVDGINQLYLGETLVNITADSFPED